MRLTTTATRAQSPSGARGPGPRAGMILVPGRWDRRIPSASVLRRDGPHGNRFHRGRVAKEVVRWGSVGTAAVAAVAGVGAVAVVVL